MYFLSVRTILFQALEHAKSTFFLNVIEKTGAYLEVKAPYNKIPKDFEVQFRMYT